MMSDVIPAYRDMQGTVLGYEDSYVAVIWDMDDPKVGPPRSLLRESRLCLVK